jgi:hypothetical protein
MTEGTQPTTAEPQQPISIDVNVNLPGYTSPTAEPSASEGISPQVRPICQCLCGSQSGHGQGG